MNERIQTLLKALGCTFVRTEPKSTCKDEKECGAGHQPLGTMGTTYHIHDGKLKGVWTAWGPDADLVIFDRMTVALEKSWASAMTDIKSMGAALREVSR